MLSVFLKTAINTYILKICDKWIFKKNKLHLYYLSGLEMSGNPLKKYSSSRK